MPDDNLNPSGDQQKASESDPESPKGEQGDKGEKGSDPSQYITPERLQGVLQHQKKAAQKELQSSLDKLKNSLTESLSQQIAEALKKKDENESDNANQKGNKKDQPDPELVSLRRRAEEQEKSISTLKEELSLTKTRAKESRMKARVMEALGKYDCELPEVVYTYIKDKFEEDEENGNIFANVQNEFGTVEPISLDEFIKSDVREKMMPQLFKGANRGGGPAEGDKGGPGRRYKYDWNTVKSQVEVLQSEEFQKAMDAGEVANLPA